MDHSPASRRREKRKPRPLDERALRDLALTYVARFATTSGKLKDYLRRKLRERGVQEGCDLGPVIEELVRDFAERGYIDDAAWARDKAASLAHRGYGGRRIDQALRAAGIEGEEAQRHAPDEVRARSSVIEFARRKRFGPFGAAQEGLDQRRIEEKQLAAMVRAGHDFHRARKVLDAAGIGELEEWVAEAQEEFHE